MADTPKLPPMPEPFKDGLVQVLNEARCLSDRTVGNRELAGRIIACYERGLADAREAAQSIGQAHPQQGFPDEPPSFEVRFGPGHTQPAGGCKRVLLPPRPVQAPAAQQSIEQARELSDEEIDAIARAEWGNPRGVVILSRRRFARAILAAARRTQPPKGAADV